jgi:hypothetical protein
MVAATVGVVSSSSREGFVIDGSDSDGESQSDDFDDEVIASDLDSTNKAKVATATAAVGKTFDFGASSMGKDCIRTLEGLSYFVKGATWSPGPETVLEPRVDEVVVFEDLFTAVLHMPPHPVLMDILQKFQVQLHQLMPNAIV